VTVPRAFMLGVVPDGVAIVQGFSDDAGMDELQWRLPPRQGAECYVPVVTGISESGGELDTGQGRTMVDDSAAVSVCRDFLQLPFDPARNGCRFQDCGGILWFLLNRFSGSQRRLSSSRRS
jgi:hypothetical protein